MRDAEVLKLILATVWNRLHHPAEPFVNRPCKAVRRDRSSQTPNERTTF